MKFKHGDKVRIIQRKPENKTGTQNYNKPNGDVGVICYLAGYKGRHLTENEDNTGKYYGIYDNSVDIAFQDDDLELVSDYKISKFNIGDIIDTNKNGYQYTNMDLNAGESAITKRVIEECNCRTNIKQNIKILDKVYSSYTGNWWYQTTEYGNWISEEGITLPETKPELMEKNEFKKGDYIVITYCSFFPYEGKLNYCYKLIDNEFGYAPVCRIPLDEPHRKKARYATPEEIAEYDRLNKPYDVTTLNVHNLVDTYFKIKEGKAVLNYNSFCVKGSESNKNFGRSNLQSGDIFQGLKRGEHIASDLILIYGKYKNQEQCFSEYALELSTKEEYHAQFQVNLVGRYLKALVDYPQSTDFRKGDYVKILDFYYDDKRPGKYKIGNKWCYTTTNLNKFELMPEGFVPPTEPKAVESPKTEDLIDEARRRYPVGTKFHPSHVVKDNRFCVITPDSIFIENSEGIYSKITTINDTIYEKWVDGDHPQYGNCSYNRYVYYKSSKKWAEIVEPVSEEWKPKVGDWVVGWFTSKTANKYHEKAWEIGSINHEYAYPKGTSDNTKIENLRKAEPHEIPKSETLNFSDLMLQDLTVNLTMADVKKYTAEEALAELKRLGFKKGVEYDFMHQNGNYTVSQIREAKYDPSIAAGGAYIDCGSGYLWSEKNPSVLHKGPIAVDTDAEYPLTPEEVFYPTQLNSESDYLKPETLLTKTTLNY